MDNKSAIHLIVSGKVQGVSFRWFTVQTGQEYGLGGYAKNLNDGTVEIRAEGTESKLNLFIDAIKNGPPFSRVDNVIENWSPPTNQFNEFYVAR